MTVDNEYLLDMMKDWEDKKEQIRKELPRIYKEGNEEIRTIIAMLVASEYVNKIELDNKIRNNNPNTNNDTNAQEYSQKNQEIMRMVGM